MRCPIILLIILCLVNQGTAQTQTIVSCVRLRPVSHKPYDIHTVDKRLKISRRCIIAGSVLTGVGAAVFIAGCVSEIVAVSKPADRIQGHIASNYTPISLWISGIPFLATGIPVLAIGVSERHRWQKRREHLQMQAGMLNNGHVGIAMGF